MPKHGHDMPDFRLPEAWEGKIALKALCLVSRDFRAMSQGILFHYFLNYSRTRDSTPFHKGKNLIPEFLRALISNPSLCSQVRHLTLFERHDQHRIHKFQGITRQDLQAWNDASARYHIHVPNEVTQALAAAMRDDESVLSCNEPRSGAQLLDEIRQHEFDNGGAGEDYGSDGYTWNSTMANAFYKWLCVLLLNLVPQVTHLKFNKPLGFFEELQSPAVTFPQLRGVTYDRYYEFADVLESMARFPNLCGLVAGPSEDCEDRWLGPTPATNLRRLSVHCSPRSLSKILQLCPYLEDLECQLVPCSDHPEPGSLQWPEHTKKNLRRLAWNNMAALENLEDQDDPKDTFNAPLLEFERLEILEIEQASLLLYVKLLRANTMSAVLPKTLQVFYIATESRLASDAQLGNWLRKLACAKPTILPRLRIIQVDDELQLGRRKKTLAGLLKWNGVVRVLNYVGIDLRIAMQERHCCCVLSPRPGPVDYEDEKRLCIHDRFALDDYS